jgi:hypothetical protein
MSTRMEHALASAKAILFARDISSIISTRHWYNIQVVTHTRVPHPDQSELLWF